MDHHEKAVMYYLAANGETLISPQIKLDSGQNRADFIAIRPSQKKAYVIELTDSDNPDSLTERVNRNETKWLKLLEEHLEGRGIADSSWSYNILLFVRRDQFDWVKEKIKDQKNVNIIYLEDAVESWRWGNQMWTSGFSFETDALKHSAK